MPELPDRAPATTIEETHVNLLRDRSLQRYDDLTTRGSEHPSPTAGDLAFMQDTGEIYVFFSGSWQKIKASDAADILTGVFADARIPSLAAGKITSGVFADARIPSLATSKITSGTFSISRLPTGTSSSTVATGNHTHNYAASSHTHNYASSTHNHNTVYVGLSGNQTISGTKTFSGQPQMPAGLDIPGSGTIQMHWPGLLRRNDSAWGSIRLEGDVGYRMYFHTSTKYVKENEKAITAERSREAIKMLQPLTYDSDGKRNIGFFAENVQKAEPLTAPPPRETENGPDEVPTYSEDGIIAHLVGVVKDLMDRVDELEAITQIKE